MGAAVGSPAGRTFRTRKRSSAVYPCCVVQRLLTLLYRRTGRIYPFAFIALELQSAWLIGIGTVAEPPGQRVHEDAGLPRARARDDEQRAIVVVNDRLLIRVKPGNASHRAAQFARSRSSRAGSARGRRARGPAPRSPTA